LCSIKELIQNLKDQSLNTFDFFVFFFFTNSSFLGLKTQKKKDFFVLSREQKKRKEKVFYVFSFSCFESSFSDRLTRALTP